jgi:hypothetical protein
MPILLILLLHLAEILEISPVRIWELLCISTLMSKFYETISDEFGIKKVVRSGTITLQVNVLKRVQSKGLLDHKGHVWD